MNTSNHADAAGTLCISGADGTCALCGVAMTKCDHCTGIGYHAAGCQDSDVEFTASNPLAAGCYSGTWSGYEIELDSDDTKISCRYGIRGSMMCRVTVGADGSLAVEF